MTLEDSIQGFRLRVLTDATRSGNVTLIDATQA